MKKAIVLFLIMFVMYPTRSISKENTTIEVSQTEILSSQKDAVNISKFVDEAQKYTKDVYEDIDFNQLLNSALQGNIDNKLLYKSIFNVLGKETISSTGATSIGKMGFGVA